MSNTINPDTVNSTAALEAESAKPASISPTRIDPAALTGLELLQLMAKGVFPHPPISKIMPMKCSDLSEGTICFDVEADNSHLNPMGGVHGGFAATVIDSVTACAVHTTLGAGDSYSTVDLNVKMVRPLPKNTSLQATGRVLNVSKTVAIAEGDIRDSNGKLYAHGSATCVINRCSKQS